MIKQVMSLSKRLEQRGKVRVPELKRKSYSPVVI
jgi:hypothetical protein